MKKGFTIVELIAIIILISLLALITIPRITSLIDDSTKSTEESAAKNYIEILDKSLLEGSIEHSNSSEYELNQVDLGAWAQENAQGDIPESGRILVKNKHVESAIFQMPTYKVFCSKTNCQAVEDFGDYIYYIGDEVNIKDALKGTIIRPVTGEPYLRYHVENKTTGLLGSADVCIYLSNRELCINENQAQSKTDTINFFSEVVGLKEDTTCAPNAEYCVDDPQNIDVGYCGSETSPNYSAYYCQIASTKIANELHLVNKPVGFLVGLIPNLGFTISDTVSKRLCMITTSEYALSEYEITLDENENYAYMCIVNE